MSLMLSHALTWSAGGYFPGRGALLVDRDGIVNRKVAAGYVFSWSDLEPIEMFASAVSPIAHAGIPVIILTNQSCIGRGMMDREAFASLMMRLAGYLEGRGIAIAGYECCPHAPWDGCTCRKPRPGLLRQCEADFGISLERSAFIGDDESDLRAGTAAGVTTLLADASRPVEYLQAFSEARRHLLASGHREIPERATAAL